MAGRRWEDREDDKRQQRLRQLGLKAEMITLALFIAAAGGLACWQYLVER